jgi:hypothetical protein
MIKLTDLLGEAIVKPENIYSQGQEPKSGETDLMNRGFKLGNTKVDPETGASVSDVEYLPEFENIRRKVLSMRKEFQPFKFSSNPDIAKISKDINTHMTKVSQLIFALDKMIELQRKSK